MNGGMTFRRAIDVNKEKIVESLKSGGMYTRDIHDFSGAEKDMIAIRKALNELRKEGKVTTDDHVHFWLGKLWTLAAEPTRTTQNI